jgi:putative addiction module component (TIGR02574 family)
MTLSCGEPWGTLGALLLEDMDMSLPEVEAVRVEALALPERERAELARDLVASLDGPAEADVAVAWDRELCRRIKEIESGRAQLLDIDDVLEKSRQQLTRG